MKLKHEDGREFNDDVTCYKAGDFAIVDGAAFVVHRADGDTAHVVDHPESARMWETYIVDHAEGDSAIERCARIHWQAMARGWFVARDAGFIGGEVVDGLHMFTDDEEWVIAKDDADAISVMAEQCGWIDGFVPEDFEMCQLDDDDKFMFCEVERTNAEWCKIHGRGWFAAVEQ